MKKVIAFSLWGDIPMYWMGARKNIDLATHHYPDWVCRFYIDAVCDPRRIADLRAAGAEIALIASRGSHDGMFWRFLAAADPAVDVMLSRDADSRIGPREVAAVAEWLASGKAFHIMRDHPWHAVPILGGMWGARRGLLPDIASLIAAWPAYENKGCDQDFLGQIVYPRVRDFAMEHSGYGLSFGGATRAFPTALKKYGFVGSVFDEYDTPNEEHWAAIECAL